ncbi:MAG: NAD(P)-binding domain-containing protein [Gemmatimonadota bacterium]|nr:NAD(P)-binding domain-containing protein [Gemmatimonadota bacterium]MDZ4863832.1 NAD(P)-binding domain-containing protein [Gemmatimonadota bacterium]
MAGSRWQLTAASAAISSHTRWSSRDAHHHYRGGVGWRQSRPRVCRQGHTCFGAREPGSAKLAALLTETGATALPVAQAVQGAEVVVLATPWDVTLATVHGLELRGKVVVDATNPLLPNLAGLAVGSETSGAEEIQRAAPGALVVKCFNTTGANNYLTPAYPDGAAMMPYCGDDAPGKAVVRQLGEGLGFDMVDLGPLSRARQLESLALFWITLAYPQGLGRDFALRLMRR